MTSPRGVYAWRHSLARAGRGAGRRTWVEARWAGTWRVLRGWLCAGMRWWFGAAAGCWLPPLRAGEGSFWSRRPGCGRAPGPWNSCSPVPPGLHLPWGDPREPRCCPWALRCHLSPAACLRRGMSALPALLPTPAQGPAPSAAGLRHSLPVPLQTLPGSAGSGGHTSLGRGRKTALGLSWGEGFTPGDHVYRAPALASLSASLPFSSSPPTSPDAALLAFRGKGLTWHLLAGGYPQNHSRFLSSGPL